MKNTLVIFILSFLTIIVKAQDYTPTAENLEMRKNFQDMKFGMFIHWGPFSIPGSGEWVMNNRKITVKNYTRLKDFFNPIHFDVARYVSTAKAAGMKYITLITRHHDGFSMFDTKYSDFNIMQTPYKRDIVKMFADECHKQGLKIFFYYSLLDWRRDDYSYWTGSTGKSAGRTVHGDWNSYISFMKNQLTELLTNYGKVDGIWFDGYWDQIEGKDHKGAKVDWHMPEIYTLIHKLQPACLIGNNHHLSTLPGEDFQMFEKDLPGQNSTGFGTSANSISQLPLETCETMNDSWGFNITDTSYKSVKQLLQYIVRGAGSNANFLLNIGPMPDGSIQPEFIDTLKAIGVWMNKYGESIYNTRGAIFPSQDWGTVTANGKTAYIHLLKKPATSTIHIPFEKEKVLTAVLMGNATPLKFKQDKDGLHLDLTNLALDDIDTIIKVTVK